jgi:pimeloyl-ACP methyl ester carboxylesterase
VEALVKTAVSGPVILVGSSLGAGLAQLVAMRARVEVAGLVLMDGGLPSPPDSGAGMAASVMPFLGESRYRSLRGRPEAAFESLRAYYADVDGLPEADRSFLARRVVERVDSEVQLRAYFSLLRSLVLRAVFGSRAFASFLASTRLPILIIWGRADRILPPAAADLLAGLAPRARKIIIDEAGHLPHQEAPIPTAAAILDFLEDLSILKAP